MNMTGDGAATRPNTGRQKTLFDTQSYSYSIQISLSPQRVLGFMMWTDDEFHYYAVQGEIERAIGMEENVRSGLERGLSLMEMVDYYLERGGGGYLSFSKPEQLESQSFNDAARLVAAERCMVLDPEHGIPALDEGDGPPAHLRRSHRVYSYALDLACEFLIRGNTPEQAVYVDVRGAEEWEEKLLTIWAGPDEHQLTPRLKIASTDSLTVWDGADPSAGLTGTKLSSARGSLWPTDPDQPLAEVASNLANKVGIGLKQEPTTRVTTRFAVWARMFTAAVRTLPQIQPDHPWCLETVFHGGWEAYYMVLSPLGAQELFSVAEAGHFAGVKPPFENVEATEGFNLQQMARETLDIDTLTAYLLRGIGQLRSTADP